MTTWNEILNFYQKAAQLPREGQIWEDIRYHSQRMQLLIPEIQKHAELSELECSISVVELRLVNKINGRTALILVQRNDNVRVNFYDPGELILEQNHNTVHSSFDEIISDLKDRLLT